jgi:deazaflavin-dependent oxidoreductase (nitroreductase family)
LSVTDGRRRTTADRFRWYWRIANRLEALQIRLLGTSGVGLLRRTPVLLLETTGRRTGRRRRAPVAYWKQGDDFLVGGGAAGMTRVDWVANLRANPEATIWVRRRRRPVVAEELTGAQYQVARDEAFAIWPGAARYEEVSGRRIPYFRLTPAR